MLSEASVALPLSPRWSEVCCRWNLQRITTGPAVNEASVAVPATGVGAIDSVRVRRNNDRNAFIFHLSETSLTIPTLGVTGG